MRRTSLLIALTAAFLAATFLGSAAVVAADDMDVMNMAHMALSSPRPLQPGDAAKAATIVADAKAIVAKYADVAAAERDGYKKFLPKIPLQMEHFTNDANGIKASIGMFDPMAPTSIIYERSGKTLTVVGVMYTANARATESMLASKIPLSIARWHRHVNFCLPGSQPAAGDRRFGLTGTIATKEACDAAGGTWKPQVFGWMVHVWPLETDPKKQWSVEDPNSHEQMRM